MSNERITSLGMRGFFGLVLERNLPTSRMSAYRRLRRRFTHTRRALRAHHEEMVEPLHGTREAVDEGNPTGPVGPRAK
jgi:hypothetical protein